MTKRLSIETLLALAPVDGRYEKVCEPLSAHFSEFALIRNRIRVMVHYLLLIAEYPDVARRQFTTAERSLLIILTSLTVEQARTIKDIETVGTDRHKKTNHDVKACELFLRDFLQENGMDDFVELVHIGRTSEDVNNVAYALMLMGGVRTVIRHALEDVIVAIDEMAFECADLPMLARTHGQPATPTTLGKELAVFRERLRRQALQLADHQILIKLNGASGNHAADIVAYPDIDWFTFEEAFCRRMHTICRHGTALNRTTTQIESHDSYAELFAILMRINTILIGFAQDIWSYVSEDWIVQKPEEGEVGSSTMPHKVNPIDFENAEGNLGVANALFAYFAKKLPISRRQRDLSDSTVERCFGMAFGHMLIGLTSIMKGMKKVDANQHQIRADLLDHPEVIAEAYQTILRSIGYPEGYNVLKDLTRGKKVTMGILHAFVDGLDSSKVPHHVKIRMRAITPENYIGLSQRIAENQFT